ncbi:MAG TPA: leucyl aminopeptidase [Mycobacteriales bacterium]|nr:leucyl aminopeptidase [Mycobacteriales bacterium]
MTTFTLRKGSPDKTRTDTVVIGVVSGRKGLAAAPGGEAVAASYGRKFAPMLAALGFSGKPGEVAKLPTAGTIKSPVLVLVGLGDADRLTPDAVRRAAGVAARTVANSASVALALPAQDADQVRAVTEGYLLGGYSFDTFKSSADRDAAAEVVVLSPAARAKDAVQAFETAQVVAAAVARTRDWVNTPPGDLTPPAFADAVSAAAKKHKVTVTVLDEKQLEKDGFGGIIGVGRGSAAPPRLVKLSYKPRGAKTHLGLVGKGITFDSGGLTIKPGKSMQTMKSDMGGAAAVANAALAIAELGLPIAVTAWVPMAENMVSGNATRPGDVLTMYGGQTVEVLNTDAEGRLILGDALVLASESKPDVLVDVATLTGACETALGDRVAGVMANDDALARRTVAAGGRVGEALWQLPIAEEMTTKVRTYSKVADLMQHNVDLYGGALYAAAFLQEFVGEGIGWVHLDIAGPGFNERAPWGHVTSGGTGVAVATLVELATELSGA